MNFSNLNRSAFVGQMGSGVFDLLVIGGGVTGCGIALDAALRGMKVALVEKDDFASGTSSRSTKLIHGGLRYLKQFEFKLVHENGTERAVVHRNARHLVIPEKMLLPIVSGGSLGMFSTSLGLWIYDFLAGVKQSERRVMLDRHATIKAEPLLAFEGLLGGGLYHEYRTDDARLVIELAKSAFSTGAVLLNYCACKHFTYKDEKITGALVYDKIEKKEFEISAKYVVNASGPWLDFLRKEDNSLQSKRLLLSKGVHIVFPKQKLPLQQAIYFDTGDARMIFAIPRQDITYVGTTDTVYNQGLDKVRCEKEDAQYLLTALNRMFPSVKLNLQDIISSWAGVRPLIYEEGKSASELSRKDEIIISASGLVSIAGGKLTGYRLMAEKVVDLIARQLERGDLKSKTRNFKLSGAEFQDETEFKECLQKMMTDGDAKKIPADEIQSWFYKYGKNTDKVLENVFRLQDELKDSSHNIKLAELLYAIENEMVFHINDFLIRRSGKLYFEIDEAKDALDYLAGFLDSRLRLKASSATAEILLAEEELKNAVSFLH